MEEEKKQKIKLSRCYRLFLFFIVISVEGAMNISSGLLSSATKEIKKSLKMNDAKFGMFGAANGIGRVVGSMLFGMYNIQYSRKWIQTASVGFHAFFLLMFKLTNNGNILICMRGLTGLTQMPPSIYCCVWIDQYGISSFKTIQITAVQLFQTSGKCIGYFLNMLFGLDNWKEGFALEAVYLFFCAFCCLITSEDYFSRTLFPKNKNLKENLESKSNIQETRDIEKNIDNRISSTTYEEDLYPQTTKKKKTFFDDLLILCCHSLYIISMLSRCILHGLNTCLHFWLGDFIRNVIKEDNQFKVTISYSIICFAGPFGAIIFNLLLKPIIGGYETRSASWPLVYLQIVASLLAISIGFMGSTFSVCIMTILYLIFNSSALPMVQGILISCVDPELAATGFAVASILTQSIFAGATPYLYGYINDRFKHKYPWLAMVSVMSLQFVAVPLLIALAILRNKKFDEEEKMKKEEKEEELIDN
jgi:predicted MFS family arabinose efflux permease